MRWNINVVRQPVGLPIAIVLGALSLVAGCGKEPVSPAHNPPEVTVMTVTARDTPVTFEFVAQTQSSREVEIRARVAGFLISGCTPKAIWSKPDKRCSRWTLNRLRPRCCRPKANWPSNKLAGR